MLIKKLGLLIVISVVFAAAALAQTAPLRGAVLIKNPDGSTTRLAGAQVELYRMDIKVKIPSTKTNSLGVFVFPAVSIAGMYAFAVSAPGLKAEIVPNIRVGMEGLSITLSAGDGRAPTEAEVREKVAAYQKQLREVTDANRRIEDANAIYRVAIEKGNSAFAVKNYDLAISEYDKALTADPTHPGASVLLTNKATAIRLLATEKFNTGVKTGNATLTESAKNAFLLSLEAASKAVRMLEAATPPTIPAELNKHKSNLYNALTALAESSRLAATKSDPSKEGEMRTAYEKYFTAETDPTKRWKANILYAKSLSEIAGQTGDFSAAEQEYKKLLTQNSNDPEALFEAGFVFFNTGIFSSDANKLQEAANYLQQFLQFAPASHAKLSDAKDLLNDLKNSHQITPKRL